MKRSGVAASCLLFLAIRAPLATASDFTCFYFASSPTSWVGGGQTQTITSGVNASATYNLGANSDSVTVSVGDPGGDSVTIIGPNSTLPTVGTYTNATRYPFQGSGPGLSFTSPGRGDNSLTGYFNVLQAAFDTNGQPTALAIDFMQYDEGNTNAWNWGSLRYHSDVPIILIPYPPGSCAFTVSPATITLPAKGGHKHVRVKAKGKSCPWTAVSNDPFIAITEGTNGIGPGSVELVVQGNTNTTEQVGSMTIARSNHHRNAGGKPRLRI